MTENLPIHVYIFAAILILLVLDFLIRFVLAALRVRRELLLVLQRLKEPGLTELDRDPEKRIDAVFEDVRIMKPLWREYADSLHEQVEINPQTGVQETRRRSTMPAEAFFRPELIVDMPLRADFFRHLPGIFTGVGIIGTFSGLLSGLHAFQISENPIIVRDSLGNLLHGVSMAFIVSAVAITLAMGVTFIEKWILNQLHARVEKLVQLLDDFFDAGVGEEYLARLVKASEHAASQAAPMQSALVGELRQIMTEQTEKQVSAINLLGHSIRVGIEDSLKHPLAEMAGAIRNVSAEQGTAVHAMMHDLLDRFNANLRELLGDQISGINAAQQQTLHSLQETMLHLRGMAGNIESAGERGAHAMADQLATAVAGAEARQQIMNEKMDAFVEQLTLAVSNSQDAAQAKLQHTLDDIANRMGAVIQSMSGQIQAASKAGRQVQAELMQKGREAMGEFGGQVDLLVDGVLRAAEEMKTAINAMRHATGSALSQLNAGADKLYAASTTFAGTGREMTEILGQTSGLVNRFSQVSDSISGVSGELGKVLQDYQTARDAMTTFLSSLRGAVEQSRRETVLTNDVLALINEATDKLVHAQKGMDGYLAGISEIIRESHHAFAAGMVNTVDVANQDFHRALSDSVSLLRIGIQELSATLEELGTIRPSWSDGASLTDR